MNSPSPSSPIPFWQAVLFWLKLGFISFGGPAGQIAILHQELVEKRRWISEQRFLHALNYCMVLPGPEAQQLATYLGWLMHKTLGGVVAGVLFVLPSLLILIGLSWLYLAFGNHPWLMGLFYGIKPAVIAIVMYACYRLASRCLQHPVLWAVALVSLLATVLWNTPFPLIILLASLIGYAMGDKLKLATRAHQPAVASDARSEPACINEHSPIPEHARFNGARCRWLLLIGFMLWLIPMAVLYGFYGWQHSFTQMAWFFTKAALFSFGGAYAVLPYVYQGAIYEYGWLTPGQMLDGLALGETTPGPLIMVVAFVAFVGAYQQALFGPEQLFLAGAVAAVLVTWFTFLPSFLFILAGGPLVESSRSHLKLQAPLSAISAAIVGAMLNLALLLGYAVLWPQGLSSPPDWIASSITLLAAWALFRLKWGIIPVILIGAVLGLVLHFMV